MPLPAPLAEFLHHLLLESQTEALAEVDTCICRSLVVQLSLADAARTHVNVTRYDQITDLYLLMRRARNRIRFSDDTLSIALARQEVREHARQTEALLALS